MKAAKYRMVSAMILLVWVFAACVPTQTATIPTATLTVNVPPTSEGSTLTPEPSPTAPTQTPELISEEVLLWASGATASSSRGEMGYDAGQAMGKPNTLSCGDYITAWQPAPEDTEAWIELSFFPYILPNAIHVVHSYMPGQVRKIEVVTLDEEVLTVYDATIEPLPEISDCPVTRAFSTPQVEVLIQTVRISLERSPQEPWTQIDAVGVLGWVAEELPGMEPSPTPEMGEEEFGGVSYYSNKNQITSLLFAGERLWAGSTGGVTAWELDSLSYTAYTAADGLNGNAIYALAFCDWEGGMIAAGGSGGVSLLSLEGELMFTPLPHPDFEEPYGVRSLGCDNARRQLWVAYFDHLSRYDFDTQTWQEYGIENGMIEGMPRQVSFIDEDVWVILEYGIAILRGGEVLEGYPPESSIMPSLFVHSVAVDEGGTIWMATSEGLRSTTEFGWKTWSPEEIESGEMSALLMGMEPNPDGSFWLGDHFGTLCLFEPSLQKCTQVFAAPDAISLSALASNEDGWAAVGSHEDGIKLLADGEWFRLRTKDQALDNQIYAIEYTPDGRLWLAGLNGLQYLKASDPDMDWGEVPLPRGGVPFALYAANDGLWVGHMQGALFLPYIGEEVLDLTVGDPSNSIAGAVMAIGKDAAGRIYFGTERGLSLWDGSTYQYFDLFNEVQRAILSYPPRVNCILVEGESIWVGSRSGLHRFEDGSLMQSWTTELQEISSYYSTSVGALLPDPDGKGLLVGIGSELFHQEDGAFTRVSELPSEVRGLYRTPYALWIATASSGVWSVPLDGSGVYWEMAERGVGFARNFGYQAIAMSDSYTLWFASFEGGLEHRVGMFGQ